MASVLINVSTVVALITSQGFAPTRSGSEPLDAQREARVQRLGKEFRCAVCQGVSIADSPAAMARAQLDKVRELVAEGKSDEEIEAYFVDRYGEWALLEPRKAGVTLWLWVLPVVVLIGGVVIIIRSTRRDDAIGPFAIASIAPEPRASSSQASAAQANEVAASEADDALAQVRADAKR